MIFETGDQPVQVRLEGETVWLTQAQMAELFDVQKAAISKHLKNIFSSGELDSVATVSIMETVQREGKRTVVRDVEHYNRDAIISAGYRINSRRATQFRQWATTVLRQHLVDGYTLNQQRLQEKGVEIDQVLGLLTQTLTSRQLISPEGELVLNVISDYARSWSLLQGYDEQKLTGQTGRQNSMRSLPMTHWLRTAVLSKSWAMNNSRLLLTSC